MPVTPSYPGVYVEEVPSGVRTITGVPTSIAAFVGRAARGPVDEPVTVNGFGDFERVFGGLSAADPLSYAVRDFFVNGGARAIVVRTYKGDGGAAKLALVEKKAEGEENSEGEEEGEGEEGGGELAKLILVAASPGTWGNALRVELRPVDDPETRRRLGIAADDALFDLTVRDATPGGAVERHRNLTLADSPRRVDEVLATESSLVRWGGEELPLEDGPVIDGPLVDAVSAKERSLAGRAKKLREAILAGKKDDDLKPFQEAVTAAGTAVTDAQTDRGAADGGDLTAEETIGSAAGKTGLHALEKADLFNLLCLPPGTFGGHTPKEVYQAALRFCVDRRALLLVDPPASWASVADAETKPGDLGLTGTDARNAAVYFPRILVLKDDAPVAVGASGAVAGVMARTDVQRGVWKAPAGIDAALAGVAGLELDLTDDENGRLNPLGINCLRSFGGAGDVIWGARTLRGADRFADEYKYVPVRRLALYLEESLYRGTQWAVFEPNDEPLWAQLRLNVGAFLQNLFLQGAFQGTTPREAYFVKCDKETTTQNHVDLGIVNVVVGFAPLKPAEFVILRIQQMAGQIAT